MKWPRIKMILFPLLGAALGFGYYHFVGCRTGSCPLSSNPYLMTGYGALTGWILGLDSSWFNRKPKKEERK